MILKYTHIKGTYKTLATLSYLQYITHAITSTINYKAIG